LEDKNEYRTFTPDSSFIKGVLWDVETETLAVIFKSGSVWLYEDVPEQLYTNFSTAESAGNYFNLNIRDIFEAKKLTSKELKSIADEQEA